MSYQNLSMYTNMGKEELAQRLFDLLMICNQANEIDYETRDTYNKLPYSYSRQCSVYGDISNALQKIDIVDYFASIESCELIFKEQ